MTPSTEPAVRTSSNRAPVRAVDLGLTESALRASAGDPPAVLVRAKLDEQVRALLEHEPIARVGEDPEGVHQMRVAVRRMRAALKADGPTFGDAADHLQDELKWLGGSLGAVRDLDVQLEHLRSLATNFEPEEQEAVERLLAGLVADRRRARQRMLGMLRSKRYRQLLDALAAAIRSEISPNGAVPPASKKEWAASLIELIKRPHRKLIKAADALDENPPDDDLHALRIRGKRLRYAAELAAPAGGKRVKKLIDATKALQDLLGDHQDACVAEQEIRRLLTEVGNAADQAEVGFVAGRLVERERARRTDIRARWRDALTEVDSHATTLLTSTH